MGSKALSYHQMEAICAELCPELIGSLVTSCTALNKNQLFFFLEKNSHRNILFLGFQPPYLRFHLVLPVEHPFPKETFHPLAGTLINSRLEAMELLNQDRILQLSFQRNGARFFLIGEFFTKHPNYYLLDDQKDILFSLFPAKQRSYQLPPAPSIPHADSVILSHQEIQEYCPPLEKEFQFQQEKNSIQAKLQKQLKNMAKRHAQLKEELARCQSWEQIQHEADLLKNNYFRLQKGMSSIVVWDWIKNQDVEIALDSTKAPQELLKSYYVRCRKMQVALPHLLRQIEKIGEKTTQLQKALDHLNEIVSSDSLQLFKESYFPSMETKQKKIQPKEKNLPYIEYESATGMKIWVGKNARQNEVLTFSLAKGSDWWLHVSGYSGSHVVIRAFKDKEPDDQTLQDALQLALYHSKAKAKGEAEICLTQKKFVSRYGKGHTGKVQISKHRNVFARLDLEKIKLLKEKNCLKKENE